MFELNTNFGPMNGEVVNDALKVMVYRVMDLIRSERFTFEVFPKVGYSGKMDDVVTSTDIKGQRLYNEWITKRFPFFGVVGEEDELQIPCSLEDQDIWIALDPIDGTRAFVRKEPFGVSTMLALVVNGEVVGAYIGDAFTGELFYTRPGSSKVHALTPDRSQTIHRLLLAPPTNETLSEKYLILREHPTDYSPLAQKLANPLKHNGLFKNVEISSGSIGLNFARVWGATCGGILMRPGTKTPWDTLPVLGICNKLGYVWFRILDETNTIEAHTPLVLPRPYYQPHETLVIHQNKVEDLRNWCDRFEINLET
jgi:fructose-1,6-bisphosphatase/inositol monophosphatase family enzyme